MQGSLECHVRIHTYVHTQLKNGCKLPTENVRGKYNLRSHPWLCQSRARDSVFAQLLVYAESLLSLLAWVISLRVPGSH